MDSAKGWNETRETMGMSIDVVEKSVLGRCKAFNLRSCKPFSRCFGMSSGLVILHPDKTFNTLFYLMTLD